MDGGSEKMAVGSTLDAEEEVENGVHVLAPVGLPDVVKLDPSALLPNLSSVCQPMLETLQRAAKKAEDSRLLQGHVSVLR